MVWELTILLHEGRPLEQDPDLNSGYCLCGVLCFSSVCMGFAQVLRFPSTSQKHTIRQLKIIPRLE